MDFLFLAPLFKRATLELSLVITNKDSGGIESCEDILPHELYHLPACDRG